MLVQFEPLDENFVIGDRLIVSQDDKKQALVEITKIKGAKFLARILYGKAKPGMKLEKYGMVTEVKPTGTSPNLETVAIRVYSTYVYRGIPYPMPYLAGSVDYVNEGVLGTANISNAPSPATSEIDLYLGYALNRINWTITPMIGAYTFPGERSWDTYDFMVNLTYGIFSVDASYIPEYFGVKSTDFYTKVSALIGVSQRLKISPSLGHSQVEDENAMGFKSYQDFKIGFLYNSPEFAVELAVTDTTRKDSNAKKYEDTAAAVLISKRF